MWDSYLSPSSQNEVLELLAKYGSKARLIAGGTDLLIEIERGLSSPSILVDVTRVPDLDRISRDSASRLHLGLLVTHNQLTASEVCIEGASPLAMACEQVGSPQIRNRGTIAGNLVTASPANDTITALWALDAVVTLRSLRRERTLSFDQFFLGVRKTALGEDEMLTDISFPVLTGQQRGVFLKLGLRRAQAVAVVNVAAVLTFDGQIVRRARLTMGSVAPTVMRAYDAEQAIEGTTLDDDSIRQAAQLAARAAKPIDDLRGSAGYRQRMVEVYTARALRQLRLQQGTRRDNWRQDSIKLWGKTDGHYRPNLSQMFLHETGSRAPIVTTVNGREYVVYGSTDKTLLHLLREDIGLTGTKEGCAEGECGSCTVWLDGIAVNSCLVPAPRAHGSQIVTIEGLNRGEKLHPIQRGFLEEGAVQCGYCTPGFIMAGASLLDELVAPEPEAVRRALAGCLCRCTGYHKIVSAIGKAALLAQKEVLS